MAFSDQYAHLSVAQLEHLLAYGPGTGSLIPPYGPFPRPNEDKSFSDEQMLAFNGARTDIAAGLSEDKLEMMRSLDPIIQADPIIVHVHCVFLSALKAHHQNGDRLFFCRQQDEAKRAILNTSIAFRLKVPKSSLDTAIWSWIEIYGPPSEWTQDDRNRLLTPRRSFRNQTKPNGSKAARIRR